MISNRVRRELEKDTPNKVCLSLQLHNPIQVSVPFAPIFEVVREHEDRWEIQSQIYGHQVFAHLRQVARGPNDHYQL